MNIFFSFGRITFISRLFIPVSIAICRLPYIRQAVMNQAVTITIYAVERQRASP